MILEQIRSAYPTLTRSQRLVADLVVGSYRDVAFMTASAVAQRLDLNEATVVRFAQRLGYDGYPSFLQRVRGMVHEELEGEGNASEMEGSERTALSLLQSEARDLSRACAHVSAESIIEAVEILVSTRRAIVLGQGMAGPLAALLATTARSLGLDASSPPADEVSVALVLRDVTEGDAVVAVSATWESPEVARALAYAASKGARTLAVSSSPVSPCAQQADVALCVPLGGAYSVPPLAPLCLLIDVLAQALAGAVGADASRSIRDVSDTRAAILSSERTHSSGTRNGPTCPVAPLQ